MRLGVISDTHGDKAAIQKIVAIADSIDMWLHAGDYSHDGEYLSVLTGVPVRAVRGNCDGDAPEKIDEFLNLAEKNIWLTHGHRYQVKNGLYEISLLGRQYDMDVVVFGHTHIPCQIWEDRLLLFNPGSACLKGNQCPTFGILELFDNRSIIPRIVNLFD